MAGLEQWAAECGNDDIIMIARRLSRAWDRPRPQVQVPTSPDDVECLIEQVEGYAKTLLTLAAAVERQERFKAAEEAGTLNKKRPIIIGPRVRRLRRPRRPVPPLKAKRLGSLGRSSDANSNRLKLRLVRLCCRSRQRLLHRRSRNWAGIVASSSVLTRSQSRVSRSSLARRA
jgi:hypothetical protein